MKTHTSDFKNNVKLFGRELDSVITYEYEGETIELGVEELNSISPHYEGAILKSVMRQLDIDSNVDIPLGTTINYQFGVKVADEEVEDYRDNYEYLNFGNYIVYSSEKQEDTQSYKIICYDKMLYSMLPYVNMGITYPITIRDYINTICATLGLTFKNASDTFANYNRQIQGELYLQYNSETQQYSDLGYTFRDVLDELAQATGSTICINEDDDELEIRYITPTSDTINEEYLKDINVNFGEKYGPINSIVLSRSGGSDNVYLQDQQSIETNGLCEIKIEDNQIMNLNDRSDYLPDLLSRLDGLEYYLNDFSSTGIAYYNLCDRYAIQVGESTYSCVMFNDELNVTQGLEENIHTDMPQQSETDYTKADKTDRKINQTYLIVDKQNGTIQSVVSEVEGQNSKISTIEQDVGQIKQEISNIAGMTMTQETESTGRVAFTDVTPVSNPVLVKIHPTSQNISYMYPRSNLYPSSNLYATPRKLIFYNQDENQDIEYELPDDLLYYDSTHYDEFYLSAETETCQVTKRCKYNADGSVGLLSQEQVVPYTYEEIGLTEGTYSSVYLPYYSSGYLYVTLMAKNIYTDQFYTKAETETRLTQTSTQITSEANAKFTAVNGRIDENSSKITQNASAITSEVTRATNSETSLSSRITQNADAITSEIEDRTNAEGALSSRISQTAKGISLSVNNGTASSGITLTTTKEDGTTSSQTGTIEMTGLVKFTDLSTSGNTTINGSNIKTGTINANVVNVTNINGNNIKTGTLSADKIDGGTINATNINVTNLSASNINRGSLSGIPYTYNTTSNGNVKLGDNTGGPIMGYRGTSPRWSIASFTAGGRFQTFDSSGNVAAYLNQTGVHTTSDKRLKNNINNIDEEISLNIINNLQPIEYTYKADEKTYHRGLIAQEVKKVLNNNGIKNEVYEKNKEGYYSLNYIELIPDLINCIKYLNQKIEMLENKGDDK